MASIKVVLRKNMKRKDGSIPLALRISENYQTSYFWLKQYVFEKDWDKTKGRVKRSYPNSKKLNNFLRRKQTEANDMYFNQRNKNITPKQVKQKLKGPRGIKSFFTLAADRIKNKFDRGTFSVAKSELSILYNLEEFLNLDKTLTTAAIKKNIKKRRVERISKARKSEYTFHDGVNYFKKNKKLKFQQINQSFIENFKTFCTVYLNQKNRTITNQLIFIRTLFNIAIKEGIVSQKHYPFGGDKEKIRVDSGNKIGLTAHEVQKIEKLVLEKGSSIWHTHNTWLFSFYLAGMRISDVVKMRWSDFKNDRLYYIMDKNKKALSLKIPEKAKSVLKLYKTQKKENNGYVFPFLKDVNPNDPSDVFVKTRNATKLLNKYLRRIAKKCDIDKTLSNHIARHSFGNIAGDRIHPLMLQKLYRHSDLKTTINYQANFIHRDADEALDKVINFDQD